jgi:heterodisulfide reductase subunit C
MKVDLEKIWKEFNEQAHKTLTQVEKTGNEWIVEFDKTEKNLEKMIADTQKEIGSAGEEAKKKLKMQLEEAKKIRDDMKTELDKRIEKLQKSGKHLEEALEELK